MNKMITTMLWVLAFIVFFFYIADTKITFNPFSFKCENLIGAFGWILLVVAFIMIQVKPIESANLNGYEEGYKHGIDDGFEAASTSFKEVLEKKIKQQQQE